MEIKELRIGNTVMMNGNVEIICSLHSDNTLRLVDGNSSKGCYSIDSIMGIEINEEMAMNWGFAKVYHGSTLTLICDNCEFSFSEKNKSIIATDVTDGRAVGREVNKVHEFENMYFFFTGDELSKTTLK